MSENEVNCAFTSIYEATYDAVLRFVASRCQKASDVPDLVQNTYLNFYRRLLSKGEAHIKNPKSYLFSIAQGELCRYYGYLSVWRRSINFFIGDSDELAGEELEFLQDHSIEDKMTAAELWEYIAGKDELTVHILTLYFACDLKIAEIARRIGEKESFVKNRIYRTIKELRREFAEGETASHEKS